MSLPLTLISGYLGSGKTTLINHLLRQADGRRLAILVNDFGDLAIDADLIEAQDDQMISISGGCVCCSFGDDLTGALGDLARLTPRPDHVVLETSGVALPGAISATLLFLQDYRHDGTVVLVDAETIETQVKDTFVGDTVQRQLAQADLVVLNKTDLLKKVLIAAREALLMSLAPQAEILHARFGKLPAEVLLASYDHKEAKEQQAHTHQTEGYQTFVLNVPKPVDPYAIAERLACADLGLVRAKGFVTDPEGRTKTIQVVARRWSVDDAPAAAKTGMVAIAQSGRTTQAKLDSALKSAASHSEPG